ncbi:MAG: membrane dipeptidase [Pseudomonadales bacterium]|nr:membrane dipeptidase [Pseudomonadales bacterium]
MNRRTGMRLIMVVVLMAMTMGCSERASEQDSEREVTTRTGAQMAPTGGAALAQQYLIVDTHIDTPYKLLREYQDIGERIDGGQFDYPRAVAGGLNVPFMSIYIPAAVDEEGKAKERAEELITLVEGIVAEHPDKFALAPDTKAIRDNVEAGKISMAMGMENGGPIEGDLANVRYFYDRGIRYITLAHSKSNHISDSSYDENRQWGGLSEFGKTLVPEMNRVGILVDVSHVSDEAFYDVLEVTEVPVVATHSSARHFIPGFERNMSDEMILALADNGGIIMLNIGSTFLSLASRQSNDQRTALVEKYIEENGLDPDSDEAEEAARRIREENPLKYATMDDVLDHIDHIVGLAGIDHVGIGSDFDGVGDTLPVGFKDVSDYPNFIDGLLARGYPESDIRKILGENFMRVWREAEAYARMHRETSG